MTINSHTRPRRGQPPQVAEIVDGPIDRRRSPVRQLIYGELVDKKAADNIERQHRRDRQEASDWHLFRQFAAYAGVALVLILAGSVITLAVQAFIPG